MVMDDLASAASTATRTPKAGAGPWTPTRKWPRDGSGISTITDADGMTQTAMIAGTLAEAVASGLLTPGCR